MTTVEYDAASADAPTSDPSPFARVPAPLARALEQRGFTELTEVQVAALDALDGSRDLRISSQTGSGKTVALGLVMARQMLAAAERDPRDFEGPTALILVPTRELATQLREELAWLYAGVRGIEVVSVTGGTSVSNDRRVLSGKPRILVGTPGRTLDHIKTGALKGGNVEQLVLDEADQMLDMGFREELEAILEAMPSERRTHLVSATFPNEVRSLAARYQSDAWRVQGGSRDAAHEDIEHVGHMLDFRDRYAALVNLLLLNSGERALVFVARRASATELAEKLAKDGFAAMPLSGDLQQAQRTRTLDAFRVGTVTTLVATDVAARGIDVPDVQLVVHADPPMDSDVYTHRSGRTGRAGKKGKSVIFATPRARRRIEDLARRGRNELHWKPVPSAAKVRRELAGRVRERLLGKLEEPFEASEAQLGFANGILAGRDPAEVVARIVSLQEAELTREPFDITPPPERGGRNGDRGRDFDGRRGRDGDGRGRRDGDGWRRDRGPQPGYIRFEINWGGRGGASPRRILAMACRRGGISGRDVGSIQVRDQFTTIEVVEGAAPRFEDGVRKPDERQPWMRIEREGGGGRGGRRDGGYRENRRDGGARGGNGRRDAGWRDGGGRRDGGRRDGGHREGGRGDGAYRERAERRERGYRDGGGHPQRPGHRGESGDTRAWSKPKYDDGGASELGRRQAPARRHESSDRVERPRNEGGASKSAGGFRPGGRRTRKHPARRSG